VTIRTFDGGVAIVTGGASGIGHALGSALAARGCKVVLADLDADLAAEAAAGITESGGAATAVELDVTDSGAVQRVFDEVAREHGRLDYVFNNAGIGVGGEVSDQTVERWRRIVEVNLMGVVHGVQAAYPVMLRQGYGHVINTASMAGLLPGPVMASYSMTKHAVVGLSKAMRVEARDRGVRVSALCPGVIRTPILSGGRHGLLLPDIPESRQREVVRNSFERFRPMEPSRFAPKVLDQIARNKAIIIVPGWWRALWWLERLSPALSMRLSRRALAVARDARSRM